jgi:hypothetical protein
MNWNSSAGGGRLGKATPWASSWQTSERWSCCLFTHVLLPDYFELDLKQVAKRKLFIKKNEVAAGRTAMVEGET